MLTCYNTTCSNTIGTASATFASAVQYFAAAQCMLGEGIYPEANINQKETFDFIIVGAGSTGCVLANRLSEQNNWKVLLIEAGSDPPIESTIPGFHLNLHYGKHTWNYRTVNDGITMQAYINGTISWPRGKVIGGSSYTNGMVYSQGNDYDYQRWHDAGNKEWSVDNVRRCFRKAEDFEDINLDRYPDIRNHYGHNGPLIINTFNNTYRSATKKVLSAWNEMGIPNVLDLNVANAFGSGIMRATASNGKRNSVSKSYLKPIIHRKNLKLIKNGLVTKILINSSNTAYGVEVDHNGKKVTFYATKEVIISAGAVNSPQLLMLSGIGPKEHLRSKNITPINNLPMVGQNLQDHTFFPITICTNDSDAETESDIHFQLFQYFYSRMGYLTHFKFYDILAFYSLATRANYPDFQVYVIKSKKNNPGLKDQLKDFNGYKESVAESILQLNKKYTLYDFYVSLLHPQSMGNISLSSNNPDEHPQIHPNYFSNTKDFEVTVSGIEKLLNVLNTKFFKSIGGFLGRIRIAECNKFELGSRNYFKCIAKNLVTTVFHPVGTCKMGSNSNNSVVNSRLRVHGIKNLRVIDASIMPNHVSGNTNGPCVMIGERGAELIKEDYEV